MNVNTKIPAAGLRRTATWAACAAVCGLMACVDPGTAAGPRADEAPAPAQALQESPSRNDGVPPGCTREWSPAAADSVLNCPDLRPPAPR